MVIIKLLIKKKENAQHESCKLSFIGGCSPGGSTLDSSEKLLQRGRGKSQYICDFGKGGIHATKHIFFQKVSAGLMKLLLVTRNSHHHGGF